MKPWSLVVVPVLAFVLGMVSAAVFLSNPQRPSSQLPSLPAHAPFGISYPQFQTPIVSDTTSAGAWSQGDTVSTTNGTWQNAPTSYTYQWQDCNTLGASCSNIAAATASTYVLAAGDVGDTLRSVVTAHNGGGSASATSGPTGIVSSSGGGSTLVGIAGAPTPSCTTTVAVNGNVSSALSSAASGATVCLASGSWSEIDVTGSTSVPVTLSAVTPSGTPTTVNGVRITASQSNLTIQGLKMTQGFYVLAGGAYTLQHNTSEGWGNAAMDAQTNSAYFPCPGCSAGGTLTSLQILYNQIDTVPQCFQDDGPGNVTFEHNVCGPHIGNGGEVDVHYIQAENIANDTFNNNTIIGPLGVGAGGHPNVLHSWGSNVTFDNNILWHVDGFQHLQMNDDGASTNMEISNNLDVEDPSESAGAYEQIANNFSLTGFTQNTNTVIGVAGETASDYTVLGTPSSCTVSNNIGAGNAGNGSYAVSGSCTSSSNVSTDTSAPGTGFVHNWTASWQNTTWTPTDGSPWVAPPSNYYKPVAGGGVTSAMGYQGAIGP